MKMIDALYPNGIPAGVTCDAIAAYIDHPANPDSFAQAVAKYPTAIHVKISAHTPGTVGAHVLDVERGTYITPQQAVTWVVNSRKQGIDPTVYCNQLDTGTGWPACKAAFAAAGVAPPHWWVANYDGDPTIPTGASAKQYTDLDANGHNTYDTSSTVPGWMENDMPLTDADIARIWEYGLTSPTDGKQHRVGDYIVGTRVVVGQTAAALTPANLTKALQAAGGTATEAQMETAIRNVLGSLGTVAPQ